MSKISFIYFDVGGVVIRDFSGTNKWQKLKQSLGITEDQDAKFEKLWQEHSNRICIDFDVDQLVPVLKSDFGLPLSEDYSLVDEFVRLYDPNPLIWPIIELVQKRFKSGLLTNMYPHLLDAIYARSDLRISWPWDVVVDSSAVKLQKPDEKIFTIAEKMAGVGRDEILFIDNGIEHVHSAQKFGWQTFFYDSSDYKKASLSLTQFINGLL